MSGEGRGRFHCEMVIDFISVLDESQMTSYKKAYDNVIVNAEYSKNTEKELLVVIYSD